MPPPAIAAGGIMFSGCPSVRLCVRLSVRIVNAISWTDGRISTKLCTNVTYGRPTIWLGFQGQRVKGQGHAVMTKNSCGRDISWTDGRISTKLCTHITYGRTTVCLGFEGQLLKGQGHAVTKPKTYDSRHPNVSPGGGIHDGTRRILSSSLLFHLC